jgi:hypothetical protein
MLTPRVLGTSYYVLLLQVLCRMKKLLSGVKRALSSSPSNRGSGSRFGDISICTTVEMEKYESLHHREFAHTRVYDVNLLERVGLDVELPSILWTIY